MQPNRQLQWTNVKATLENVMIFFSRKQQGAVRTDQKIIFSSDKLF